MIFKYKTTNTSTFFEAIPETEQEKYGFRAQGPYP